MIGYLNDPKETNNITQTSHIKKVHKCLPNQAKADLYLMY